MVAADKRMGSVGWKRVRLLVLERDNYRCQVRRDNCRGVATEVDHIIPPLEGGPFFDPTNLRASCKPCNAGRGAELANRRQSFGYRNGVANFDTRL